MRQLGHNKVAEAETRVGMSVERYFEDALLRDLGQREMAKELGISRQTVCNWLRRCGYKPFIVYRKVA